MAKKKYLTAKTYKNINKAKKEKVVFEQKTKDIKAQTRELPNIFRIIPAQLKKLSVFQWVMSIGGLLSALTLFVVLIFLAQALATYTFLQSQQKTLIQQKAYWQGIVNTYPDYPDAYSMLSVLEYKLGEKQAAEISIGKALELDPNDKKAQEFKEKLENER